VPRLMLCFGGLETKTNLFWVVGLTMAIVSFALPLFLKR
jgi:hypothetical protein